MGKSKEKFSHFRRRVPAWQDLDTYYRMQCQCCQWRNANSFKWHRKHFFAPKTWIRQPPSPLDMSHRLESFYRHIREIKDMIEYKLARELTLQSAKVQETPVEHPKPKPLVLMIGDHVLYDAKDTYDWFCKEIDEEITRQSCDRPNAERSEGPEEELMTQVVKPHGKHYMEYS